MYFNKHFLLELNLLNCTILQVKFAFSLMMQTDEQLELSTKNLSFFPEPLKFPYLVTSSHYLETSATLILFYQKSPIFEKLHCMVSGIRNRQTLCTVFENHRKSLIQHCERSELTFSVDKSSLKMPKMVQLGDFMITLQ